MLLLKRVRPGTVELLTAGALLAAPVRAAQETGR